MPTAPLPQSRACCTEAGVPLPHRASRVPFEDMRCTEEAPFEDIRCTDAGVPEETPLGDIRDMGCTDAGVPGATEASAVGGRTEAPARGV